MKSLQNQKDKIHQKNFASSSNAANKDTAKSKPVQNTFGIKFFERTLETIKTSGIRKLNGMPIEEFINSFTHKEKKVVKRELFKGLYNYTKDLKIETTKIDSYNKM